MKEEFLTGTVHERGKKRTVSSERPKRNLGKEVRIDKKVNKDAGWKVSVCPGRWEMLYLKLLVSVGAVGGPGKAGCGAGSAPGRTQPGRGEWDWGPGWDPLDHGASVRAVSVGSVDREDP